MKSLRVVVAAGTLVLSSAAYAGTGHSAPVLTQEEARVTLSKAVGAPYVDLTSCTVSPKASLATMLQAADEDRGRLVSSGPCAVASSAPIPSTVDQRDRQ